MTSTTPVQPKQVPAIFSALIGTGRRVFSARPSGELGAGSIAWGLTMSVVVNELTQTVIPGLQDTAGLENDLAEVDNWQAQLQMIKLDEVVNNMLLVESSVLDGVGGSSQASGGQVPAEVGVEVEDARHEITLGTVPDTIPAAAPESVDDDILVDSGDLDGVGGSSQVSARQVSAELGVVAENSLREDAEMVLDSIPVITSGSMDDVAI
ncbi:hypothetical protein BD410DRAFT_846831, partial [Rickenella mellea]